MPSLAMRSCSGLSTSLTSSQPVRSTAATTQPHQLIANADGAMKRKRRHAQRYFSSSLISMVTPGVMEREVFAVAAMAIGKTACVLAALFRLELGGRSQNWIGGSARELARRAKAGW